MCPTRWAPLDLAVLCLCVVLWVGGGGCTGIERGAVQLSPARTAVCPSRHIFYLKMPLIRAIKVPSWMRSVSLYQLLLSALWITLPAHCLLSSLCMVFSLASMPCYLIVALCNNKCKACLHPPCTPLQFFEMVIRFLAEGAASGLNVIAVYVTEILRVTGFDGG